MSRVKRIVEMMLMDNVDAYLIVSDENLRYLSGFNGSDSYILLTRNNHKFFITDARYTEQAENECPDYIVVNWRKDNKSLAEVVKEICIKENVRTLAFEEKNMSFSLYSKLKEVFEDINIKPIKSYMETLRYVKEAYEILNMKKACAISMKALDKLFGYIRPGITEKDATSELEYYMKKYGADGIGFDTILLSGSRTSLLHGKPSNKKIEEGDLLLVDFGAKYNGYICDMTRTVVVGKASEKQREIYNLVKLAQQRAIETMQVGASGKLPFRAVDDTVRGTKYYEYLYKGVGHGVGLDVHEEPFLGERSNNILKKNCIITIEPGIYIPSFGGVRIEDMVLINDGCNEIMTDMPRDLLEI